MTVHTFRRANARPVLDTEYPDNPRDLVAKLATRVLDARRSKNVGVSEVEFCQMIRADDASLHKLVALDTPAHAALEAAFAARVDEVMAAMDGASAGGRR